MGFAEWYDTRGCIYLASWSTAYIETARQFNSETGMRNEKFAYIEELMISAILNQVLNYDKCIRCKKNTFKETIIKVRSPGTGWKKLESLFVMFYTYI